MFDDKMDISQLINEMRAYNLQYLSEKNIELLNTVSTTLRMMHQRGLSNQVDDLILSLDR